MYISMRRLRLTLIFASTAALTLSCETTEQAAGPVSTVDRAKARHTAKTLRAGIRGGTYGQGGGTSMEPIYGPNTILVMAPIEFSQLKSGMIVAYKNSNGMNTVHQLIYRRGRNWVAKGLNNSRSDREPVTRENLIGVVYGVFTSSQKTDNHP